MLPAFLECSRDAAHRVPAEALQSVCPHDGAPLLVRYAATPLRREAVTARPWTMWRYREMLPVGEYEEPVSLGEGGTPLVALLRLGEALAIGPIYVKDESQNPTGSF